MDCFDRLTFAQIDEVKELMQVILQERKRRMLLTEELMFERQKNRQLEEFIEKLVNTDKESVTILDKIDDFEIDDSGPMIGQYSKTMRRRKILAYKKKIQKYRAHVKVSREYKGRSIAAKLKPRYNGKFAKRDFYSTLSIEA